MRLKKLFRFAIFVLAIILIVLLMNYYSKIPRETKVEIGIKATSNDQILKINTLACHLTDEYFKSGIKRRVYIQYPRLTFSGNIDQIYYCPDKKDGFITNLSIEAAPIGGYQNLSREFNGNDYLKNLIMILPDAELLGEKDNVQVYKTFSGIRILLKDISDKTLPFIIKYPLIEGNISSPFLYHYNIETLVGNDFMASYIVSADNNNEVTQGVPNDLAPFPIDAEFAREFHSILTIEGELGILSHPEIIQKFIENNEKVVRYIKSISSEYSAPDEKSYIRIIEAE